MSSKQYFKHNYGYINIDEEKLYFTSSGNWGEARELKEKPGKVDVHQVPWWMKLLGVLVAIFVVSMNLLFWYDIITSELSIGSVAVGGGWLLMFNLRYYRSKYRPLYFVSHEKTKAIDMLKDGVMRVKFLNVGDEEDLQFIKIPRKRFDEVIQFLQMPAEA